MSNIGFSGLGSGLPVDQIVKATVQAEAAPLKRLQTQREQTQAQISAYGQMASRLNSVRDAMRDLRGLDKFQQLSAKSGNDRLFTAKADHMAGATNGNYSVKVLAEARSFRFTTDALDDSFSLSNKVTIAGVEIGPNDGGPAWSLDKLRSEINKHPDLRDQVSANIINDGEDNQYLVLNAKDTGAEGVFTVDGLTGSNNIVDNANELNARIEIDGIEASSNTNTFTNVISGVDITLTAGSGALAEADRTSNLQVSRDDKAIRDNIDKFVKAYNDLVIHLNEAKKGPLAGDSVVRSIENQLRQELFTPTGDDPANLLSMIGIETFVDRNFEPGEATSSRNGTLQIDSAKLTAALNEDFDRVAFIIGARDDDDGAKGYAARFADLAQQLTTTTTQNGQLSKGLIQIRREGLQSEVRRIDDRIESTNMRLDLLEERLYRQFNSVEGIIANLNSTGSYIGQQLSNLPGYTRR